MKLKNDAEVVHKNYAREAHSRSMQNIVRPLKYAIEENYAKIETDFGEVTAVMLKICMKMEVGQGGEILCSKILIPTLGRILGS